MKTDENDSRVMVEQHMQIEDNGEVEEWITKASGSFYTKGNIDVITYTEHLDEEDAQTVHNLLTIQPEKVSIKRSGAVQMHQQFIQEQTTECLYQHMYGSIHMETYTTAIDYQPINTQGFGRLTIHYWVKMNGQHERKHQLTLNVQK